MGRIPGPTLLICKFANLYVDFRYNAIFRSDIKSGSELPPKTRIGERVKSRQAKMSRQIDIEILSWNKVM